MREYSCPLIASTYRIEEQMSSSACAAKCGVPGQELPRVLRELHASLKPGGGLSSSNPHGHNEEGWNHGRYGVYHDLETWRRLVSAAGFVELTHYYRPSRRAARTATLAGERLAQLSPSQSAMARTKSSMARPVCVAVRA
jgi:SAM-dependent methyltransferase